MMGNDTEHLNDLIDEIDILLGLLVEPKEEDPIKSKLYTKEYKEKIVYNSKSPSEKDQKDLILVGDNYYQSTSDKMHYVNHRGLMCESGGLVGIDWGFEGRGLKVLGESSKEVKDLPLELKKSKKSKKVFEDGK